MAPSRSIATVMGNRSAIEVQSSCTAPGCTGASRNVTTPSTTETTATSAAVGATGSAAGAGAAAGTTDGQGATTVTAATDSARGAAPGVEQEPSSRGASRRGKTRMREGKLPPARGGRPDVLIQ